MDSVVRVFFGEYAALVGRGVRSSLASEMAFAVVDNVFGGDAIVDLRETFARVNPMVASVDMELAIAGEIRNVRVTPTDHRGWEMPIVKII